MSEIKKGDLVMVVRPTPCCGQGAVGRVYQADEVSIHYVNCMYCGRIHGQVMFVSANENDGALLSRVRKIDPDKASDREREFDRLSRKDKEVA